MRAIVVFSLGLFMSGCAVQPDSPEAIAAAPLDGPAQPAKIVCKMEKPTGSNRRVQVCREVPGKLDRELTRRDMDLLQRQTEATNHQ